MAGPSMRSRIAAGAIEQAPCAIGVGRGRGADGPRERRPARVGLEAAARTASAGAPVGDDHEVPELAREAEAA